MWMWLLIYSGTAGGNFASPSREYLEDGKVPGAKTVDDVRRFYEAKVPMRPDVEDMATMSNMAAGSASCWACMMMAAYLQHRNRPSPT